MAERIRVLVPDVQGGAQVWETYPAGTIAADIFSANPHVVPKLRQLDGTDCYVGSQAPPPGEYRLTIRQADAPPTASDVLYKQATFEHVPWHIQDTNPEVSTIRITPSPRITSIHLPNISTAVWHGFREAAAAVQPFEEHRLHFRWRAQDRWSERHDFGTLAQCNENGWRATLSGLAFTDILKNVGRSQGFGLTEWPASSSTSQRNDAAPLDLGPLRTAGATRLYGRTTTQLAQHPLEQTPEQQRHAQLSHERAIRPYYCFERIESGSATPSKKAVVELKEPLTLGLEAGDAEDARTRVECALSQFNGSRDEYEYSALWQVVTQMITHAAPSALLTNAIMYIFLRLSECCEDGKYTWKLHYYVADMADGPNVRRPTTNQCIAYLLEELRASETPQWCKDAHAIRVGDARASGRVIKDAGFTSHQPSTRGTAQAGPSGKTPGSEQPNPGAPQAASCVAATSTWVPPTWPGEAYISIDVDAIGEVVARGHYGSVWSYGEDCVLKLAPDTAQHARDELLNEMLMYHHAASMQGDCLPKVKLAGYDPERGQHAIVMERAGPDAAHLPLLQVAAVSADILAAYHKLWAHGLLHGDVALRNIAIDSNGRVVLLDLGRARVLERVPEDCVLYEQASVADLCGRLQWHARQAQRARR